MFIIYRSNKKKLELLELKPGSWGEKVSIKLTVLDNLKTEITNSSKPLLPTTIIDYGINFNNVKNIKLYFIAHQS